jgi:hypothetical protein
MNFGKYHSRKFLEQEDVTPPKVLIITGCGETHFQKSNNTAIYLDLESESGQRFRCTLFGQNPDVLLDLYGEEGDDWIDREIGAKWNPEIKVKGEVKGGVELVPPEEIESGIEFDAPDKTKKEPPPALRRKEPVALKRKQPVNEQEPLRY